MTNQFPLFLSSYTSVWTSGGLRNRRGGQLVHLGATVDDEHAKSGGESRESFWLMYEEAASAWHLFPSREAPRVQGSCSGGRARGSERVGFVPV